MKTKICVKCGSVERYANGNCAPCDRARHKAWREANRETHSARGRAYYAANRESQATRIEAWNASNREVNSAYQKIWYLENREHVIARSKVYREANSEAVAARIKKWCVANPEKRRVYSQNRRAQKRNANGTHTATDIRELLFLQKTKCACCKTNIKNGYHVDHITALTNGGSNDRLNLQLLCAPCNLSKSALNPVDFMQSRGFLL